MVGGMLLSVPLSARCRQCRATAIAKPEFES